MQNPDALHPIDDLREIITYDPLSGLFTFKARPAHHFSGSDRLSPEAIGNRWNGLHAGRPALNVRRSDGYFEGEIGGRRYRAHRVAFAMHHGRWPQGEIDHIDGDPTNNRAVNLREATRAQNMRNTKGRIGTSKYCGVFWHSVDQAWRAECRNLDGRKVRLGTFRDEISAARAYDAAAREFHGEFARLNFSY